VRKIFRERRYTYQPEYRDDIATADVAGLQQARMDVEATVADGQSQDELATRIRDALKTRAETPAPVSRRAKAIAKEKADTNSDDTPKRELMAIMLTDMVGYSGSMERDEKATYTKLVEHNSIVRTAIAHHRGREIKTIGDAFLVVFRSAIDAVDCALSIQRAFKDRNLIKEDAEKILIRIGVHLGDVLITSNDVYGDGVNVVARIEALAEPGGICVSGEAFAIVRKKLEFDVEQLADVNLKNITSAPEVYRIHMQ
jgi:class 3 adenylate cyclase